METTVRMMDETNFLSYLKITQTDYCFRIDASSKSDKLKILYRIEHLGNGIVCLTATESNNGKFNGISVIDVKNDDLFAKILNTNN